MRFGVGVVMGWVGNWDVFAWRNTGCGWTCRLEAACTFCVEGSLQLNIRALEEQSWIDDS